MKAHLYSKKGKRKEELVLNPEIFGVRINKRLLALVQNAYAANKRRGTASTKERAEVRGGGKKPWKQKGTGRARASSIRSPLWRGGGTTFGPKPRDYSVALPASMRRSALINALSLRAREKGLLLIEDVKLDAPKTKELNEVVQALPLDGKKSLCIVKTVEPNLDRASRNIRFKMEFRRASDVNAYDILRREKLVIDQEALQAIEERLLGSTADAAKADVEKPKKTRKKAVKKKAEGK